MAVRLGDSVTLVVPVGGGEPELLQTLPPNFATQAQYSSIRLGLFAVSDSIMKIRGHIGTSIH